MKFMRILDEFSKKICVNISDADFGLKIKLIG